jgi:hypothetical protein
VSDPVFDPPRNVLSRGHPGSTAVMMIKRGHASLLRPVDEERRWIGKILSIGKQNGLLR